MMHDDDTCHVYTFILKQQHHQTKKIY